MQTAISINSCYRRAVQHTARWIYGIRGGQGGHQNEGEVGQRIHRQVLSQIGRTRANMARLFLNGEAVSECLYIIWQSHCLAAVFYGLAQEGVKV